MLVTTSLIAKNIKTNAKNLKTKGIILLFDKKDLKRENKNIKDIVAINHPNSNIIKNIICPPLICSLSKKA